MTPRPSPKTLVRRILEALANPAASAPYGQLASDYANYCREARTRLEQCASVLESGDELGAWRLATHPNDLLDLIASLSFSREAEWEKLCEARKLEVSPSFDARLVAKVGDLFAKPIGETHHIYTAYRAAIRKRDDKAAYEAMRLIARTNPADANAQSEIQRLHRLHLEHIAARLRKAVDADNAQEVYNLLEQLSDPMDQKAVGQVLLSAARGVVEAMRKKWARGEVTRLVSELGLLDPESDWDSFEERLAQVEEISTEYGCELEEPTEAALSKLRVQFATAKEGRAKREAQARRIKRLCDILSTSEESLGRGDTAAAHVASKVALSKVWQEIQDAGLAVDGELQTRTKRTYDRLKESIEASRKLRTRLITLACIVAVMVIAITGTLAYISRASLDVRRQLEQARKSASTKEVRELVDRVKRESNHLASRLEVAAELQAAEAWLSHQTVRSTQIQDGLQALESSLADLNQNSPVELLARAKAQVAMLEPAFKDLAPDLRQDSEARYLKARIEVEDRVRSWRISQHRIVDELLTSVERLFGSTVAEISKADELPPLLRKIEEDFERLKSLVNLSSEAGELPAPLRTRLIVVEGKLKEWMTIDENWTKALDRLQTASSLDDHRAALETMAVNPISRDPLVSAAKKVIPLLPRLATNSFLPEWLIHGDLEGWHYFLQNPQRTPFPADFPSFGAENQSLLISFKPAESLWRYYFTDAANPSVRKSEIATLQIKDPMSGNIDRGLTALIWGVTRLVVQTDGELVPQSIQLRAELNRNGDLVNGQRIDSMNELLAESAFIQRVVQLDLIKDTSARLALSPVEMIDQLHTSSGIHPAFTAFAEAEFIRMIENRPLNWGLHLSPTLREFIQKRRQIETPKLDALQFAALGRNEPWMKNLASIRPSGQLRSEQLVNHAILKALSNPKVAYFGSVSSDGTINGPPLGSDYFLAISSSGSAQVHSAEETRSSQLHPLSPIFRIRSKDDKPVSEVVAESLDKNTSSESRNRVRLLLSL